MVFVTLGTVTDFEAKKVFGQWILLHRMDSTLWPEALRQWMDPQLLEGQGLTQRLLLQWFAERTQIPELYQPREEDPAYEWPLLVTYANLERWGKAKSPRSQRGAVNPTIMAAWLSTEFLTYPIGKAPVRGGSGALVISKVLSGVLDPFDGSLTAP